VKQNNQKNRWKKIPGIN